MKKKTLTAITAMMLVLIMCAGLMTGCGQDQSASAGGQLEADTGVIRIKVNPDIAVTYDKNGDVTKIEGVNDDGKNIIAGYSGYEGKSCDQVIRELVEMINEAGYFAEEIEGEGNKITLEVESGSYLPSDDFLSTIVEDLQQYTVTNSVSAPIDVLGESNYGWTNYGDTDYGPDNDGVTDYSDTDYGTGSDGLTDYNDSAYGASQSASGSQNASASSGSQAQSGNGASSAPAPSSGQSSSGGNYGNSNYGNTNYGSTNYDDGGTTNYGSSNYDSGTNYGSTNYDDGGTTNYSSSNYGDSGYED